MTNFRDVEKIILDVGEVEYLGHKGYVESVIPMLKMLIYVRELELRIKQLENKINSKD